MADSAIIFRSGDWVHHNGSVAPGALLRVLDAGTSSLASIFTDAGLTTPASNPLVADASGLLPIGYIGAQSYKIILTTAGGSMIMERDGIPGALDTAPFLAGEFAKTAEVFNVKTGNYTMVAGDIGTVINLDTSGGSFDFTLLSAVTVGDGKGVTLHHIGTANTAGVVTSSSQTITSPTTGVTTTSFEIMGYGETVVLRSDGSNWHMIGYAPSLLRPNTPGVILIADRVTAAPASSPGTRYIVSTGFDTFETHDIIEDNGQGGFIEITPPADCGWVAYVQDEDRYYSFRGSAWVLGLEPDASDTVKGLIEIAVQSEMETPALALLAVPPARQHFHPGHPKAGGNFDGSGTPAFRTGDYGMGVITDNGAGDYTLNFDTAFADTNYWSAGLCGHPVTDPTQRDKGLSLGNDSDVGEKTTSSMVVATYDATGGASVDMNHVHVTFWGAYA